MTDNFNDDIEYYNSKIMEYKNNKKGNCSIDNVIKYVLEQNSLEEAINIAIMSKDKNGNFHPHQYRIYNDVYENFIQNLLSIKNKIKDSKNFDELIKTIEKYKPFRAGELFCYDVALRIGHYLKLLPDRIYIHAGTRKGLSNLLKRRIYEQTINKQNLPEPFCSCDLTPGQLEDFLCINKEIFINGINEDITNCKFPTSIKRKQGCNSKSCF